MIWLKNLKKVSRIVWFLFLRGDVGGEFFGVYEMKFVVSLLAVLISFGVFAEGGKNRAQNPVIADGCPDKMPRLVEDGLCDAVPAPDQSGVVVYFCGDSVFVCGEDEDDD